MRLAINPENDEIKTFGEECFESWAAIIAPGSILPVYVACRTNKWFRTISDFQTCI